MKYLVCFLRDTNYNPPPYRIGLIEVINIEDEGYIFGKELINMNDAIIEEYAMENDPYLFNTLSGAQQDIIKRVFVE